MKTEPEYQAIHGMYVPARGSRLSSTAQVREVLKGQRSASQTSYAVRVNVPQTAHHRAAAKGKTAPRVSAALPTIGAVVIGVLGICAGIGLQVTPFIVSGAMFLVGAAVLQVATFVFQDVLDAVVLRSRLRARKPSQLPVAAPSDIAIGRVVGSYRLDRLLGGGGMGKVYVAAHTVTGQPAAVKVLRADYVGDPESRRQLDHEVKAQRRLKHPGVVQILESGETHGLVYIAMELLDGEPLDRVLARGLMDLWRACRHLLQLTEALAYAHDHGVLHRDIKPANVMLTTSGVKLIDLGIARVDTHTRITPAGVILGTPQYVSPKRLMRGESTIAGDQYSLGVLAYEVISGQLPMTAEETRLLLMQHVFGEPKPLRDVGPECPKLLEEAVHRMLSKDPAQRFPHVRDVAAVLRQVL